MHMHACTHSRSYACKQAAIDKCILYTCVWMIDVAHRPDGRSQTLKKGGANASYVIQSFLKATVYRAHPT